MLDDLGCDDGAKGTVFERQGKRAVVEADMRRDTLSERTAEKVVFHLDALRVETSLAQLAEQATAAASEVEDAACQ